MAGFKSEAHKRKFDELLRDKKITQADYDKYQKATGSRRLPERVGPQKPKG